MACRVLPFAFVGFTMASLAGCGVFHQPHRAAWRGRAENICLAEGKVRPTAFIRPLPSISGPGICGLDHPFRVSAVVNGSVAINPPAVIGCPLTAAIESWLANSLQPSAQARLGAQIVQINTFGAYDCRTIDHRGYGRLSEHSFGNAIDVSGFRFSDGRTISVLRGWNSPDDQVRAFFREAEAGACENFTTVLAPGSDPLHNSHFHLDLANHGHMSQGPRRYCRPIPKPQLLPPEPSLQNPPGPPPSDEELDSQNGGSASVVAMHNLDLSAPPAPVDDHAGAPVRPNAERPLSLSPTMSAPRERPATIRPDGAYVPQGAPAAWDVTSSIPTQ